MDLILILIGLEAVAMAAFWTRTGRGIAPADFTPMLCAGALLLLAFRVTISGSGWAISGVCLAAAGFAHLIDVARRWRR